LLRRLSSGELHVFEKVGQGHFGTVHRGEWRGAPVVIKRVQSSDSTAALSSTVVCLLSRFSNPYISRYRCRMAMIVTQKLFCGPSLLRVVNIYSSLVFAHLVDYAITPRNVPMSPHDKPQDLERNTDSDRASGLDAAAVAELLQEAAVHETLDAHPNVVRLCGSCVVGSEVWLVSEYVPGGSVRDALDAGRLQKRDDTTRRTKVRSHVLRPCCSFGLLRRVPSAFDLRMACV